MASTSFSNEERFPYIVVKKYKPPSYKYKPPSLLLEAHQHASKLEVPSTKTRSSLKDLLTRWTNIKRTQPLVKEKVDKAGFGDFLDCLWRDQMDRKALLALNEHWWDTTNTFYLKVWAYKYLKLGAPLLKNDEFFWLVSHKWNP